MSTPTWWERYPGRLEVEIDGLEAAGWTVEPDEAIREREDRLVLHLRDGPFERVPEARVEFPDVYPFLKPLVVSEGLDLPRHHSPLTGELCLLADGTIHWESTDTVAGLISSQLPVVLRAADIGPAAAAEEGIEERAPEPVRLYLSGAAMVESGIIVDFDWDVPPADRGTLELAYFPNVVATDDQGRGLPVVRGVVARVLDGDGDVLATADPRLLHDAFVTAHVPWVAIDHAPLGAGPESLASMVHQRAPWPSSAQRTISFTLADGGPLDLEVVAVFYRDAIKHDQRGTDVTFVARARTRKTDLNGRGDRCAAIRTYRAGQQHLLERVPALVGMPESSVLQVGVGGLGAPLGRMLGQSQVGRMTLTDYDHFDPATTPRFPASVFDAGAGKAGLLGAQIRHANPYTVVKAVHALIGAVRHGAGTRQDARLEELIQDHDLVLDTSAEVGVQYLLSDICRRLRVPYVAAWATEGAWGGAVVRLTETDGSTPCFLCLQAALEADDMLPPRDPAHGRVAPAGCGSLTFTGTSFDLAPIVAEAARTVSSILSPGYGQLAWDLSTCALRDERGAAIPPTWRSLRLNGCDHPMPNN